MQERNIYSDIAKRTQGDIYIGVVGPVRTGKSTFIKRFMDTIVIPNIDNAGQHDRAVDELPQSSAGRTIMTTEPKFIPENAVEINLPDNASFKVRMIVSVILFRARSAILRATGREWFTLHGRRTKCRLTRPPKSVHERS